MTKKQTSPHILPFAWREMPAFRSGFFVAMGIVAALLNMGAFVLLLAARMTISVVRFRERRGYTWLRTSLALAKEHWLDLLLFTGALLLVTYGDVGMNVSVNIAETLYGMTLVFLKGWLMLRLLPPLLHPLKELEDSESSQPFLTAQDQFGLCLILVGWFLLLLTPSFVPGGWRTVAFLLKRELVPWRM
jgi:hypothetical protein